MSPIRQVVLGVLVALIGLYVVSCSWPRSAADNVVLQWNEAALQGVRDGLLGPPMVARALAIVHTCMYDAWAAYDATAVGTQFGDSLRRPAQERSAAHKDQAMSFAAYRALVDLFPAHTSEFAATMRSHGYDPNDLSVDRATPTGIGNLTANAVLAFRHHDGSNQYSDLHPGEYSDYTNYEPVNDPDHINDPNRWQPIAFLNPATGKFSDIRKFTCPFWGKVIPFAMTSGSQFRPATGPARFPSAAYEAQAERILQLTADLTDKQKTLAEYWANGPHSELPPGHWCLFAQFVSLRDKHTADEDVKMFFALTNALLDAGIAAWDTKRAFDSERPITAICYLKAGKEIKSWGGPGKGVVAMRGEDWKPYQPYTFITPPFPEFVSAHSVFSAAAATILQSFTGSDRFGGSVTFEPGSSETEPGVTPTARVTLFWPTFTAAADEAGISRVYGGIHFEDSDRQGRLMGRAVGAQAWAKAQAYISGKSQ